jgi:hypothetical protein
MAMRFFKQHISLLILLFALMCADVLHAQFGPILQSDTIRTPYYNCIWYITPTDTLVQSTFAPIEVSSVCTNRANKRSYDRLMQRIIKVYPYAKVAGDVMNQYAEICKTTTDPKVQEQLLEQAEDALKAQFEKDLRNMTISEGIVLIKLIDRETGKTSYKLVQELKGKFSAFMWQSVARVFGHDLKDDYDPAGEDVWIENIVRLIEDGSIPVEHREVNAFHLAEGH